MNTYTYEGKLNNAWVVMNPIQKDLSFIREMTTPTIERLTSEGLLRFVGTEYTTLKALFDSDIYRIEFRITEYNDVENTTNVFTGFCLLRQTWNYDLKYCELKFIITDKYYKLYNGETNIDTKINVLGIETSKKIKVKFQQREYEQLYFYDTQGTVGLGFEPLNVYFLEAPGAPNQDFGTTGELFTASGNHNFNFWYYLREIETRNKLNGNVWGIENGWLLLNEYTDTFEVVRGWEYTLAQTTYIDLGFCFDTSILAISDVQNTDTYIKYHGHGYTYVTHRRFTYTDGPIESPTYYVWYILFKRDNYTFIDPVFRTRTQTLKTTIEFLVNKIDSSIVIDNETWRYFDANNDIRDLRIASMQDFTYEDPEKLDSIYQEIITNTTGSKKKLALQAEYQKYAPQTDKRISLNEILTWFSDCGINLYWYLRTVSGVNYLRFRQIKEIEYVTQSVDLTNYVSNNWVQSKELITDDTNYFSAFERSNNGISSDFKGENIKFPLVGLKNVKSVSKPVFYMDTDILLPTPVQTEDGWFMFTTYFDNKNYESVPLKSFTSGDPENKFSYAFGKLAVTVLTTNQNAVISNDLGAFLKDEQLKILANFWTPDGFRFNIQLQKVNYNNQKTYEIIYSNTTDSGTINFNYAFRENLRSLKIMIFAQSYSYGTVVLNSFYLENQVENMISGTGAISQKQILNVALSQANIDAKYYGAGTLKKGIINSTEKTDIVKIRDKKQNDIKIPNKNNIFALDFAKYVNSNVGHCAIEKLTRKVNGDFDTITISKIE